MKDTDIEKENKNKNSDIKNVNIVDQVQNSFLDYSMSVIISRAIPDVYDGMKPAHRRVVYSMYESNNLPDKPFRKCARIVGDVIGKYHPHGNETAYGTLVRLAQSFVNRYVLIDGNGNFGSIDGDVPAAMRYTEARLNKLAMYMVKDLEYNVVNFVSNYDGTEQEPIVLPSRFPNILVNGSSGIAVGMATNIPSHNLGEVIDATIAVAKNPNLSLEEIMHFLKGPDFPTGGIIVNKDGIKKAYETGVGSILIRSKYHIEKNENKRNEIIIDEIPYGVNKANLIEEIALLVRNKIIDGITNIRDETNKDSMRIVITVRNDCIPEIIINHLFKLTQLQKSFGIIMLCLEQNIPKVLSLSNILNDYVEFQINIITKKINFLLKKEQDRKHINLGLLMAINKINEVIEIIKSVNDNEELNITLMNKFNLSEAQVQAILSMTLRRLSNLEKNKLNIELIEIDKKINNYQHILESRENKIKVIINELEEIKSKFADDRRTEIAENIKVINDEDLIIKKNIIIIITKKGYIKRIESDAFRIQKKGGKGVKSTILNENDLISLFIYTKTHSDLLLFSNYGLVYRIKGYNIPEYSKTAKGIPIQNLLNLDKNEFIVSIVELNNYDNGFLTFFTKNGLVKRSKINEFFLIRKNGKIAIKLKKNDQLFTVKYTNGESIIGIASNNGKMVNFHEKKIRISGRNSCGVVGIKILKNNYVVGVCTSFDGDNILSITQNGYGKITKLSEYRLTNRGAKGVFAINESQKNGSLIDIKTVKGNENLMIITTDGIIIRISLTKFKLISRNTIGVKIINLDKKQKVLSAIIIPEIE